MSTHVERAVEVDDFALDVHRVALALGGSRRAFFEDPDRARALVDRFLRQDLPHDPMDDEIRVAPNGRSEVQVVRAGEAEVTDVRRVVRGLLHRSQEEHVEDVARRVLRDALQEARKLLRVLRFLHVERHAERRRHRSKAVELGLVGRTVYAVDGRRATLGQEARDELVGKQHELLDELVGLLDARILASLLDPDGRARFRIEHHLHFGELEIERAASQAVPAKQHRRVVEDREIRDHPLGGLALRRPVGEPERPRDAAVGELRRRAHERLENPVRRHRAGRIELDFDRETKANRVGQERAQVRRERARQHGDGAIGQVDRAASLERRFVERRAGAHVVRHVGDRNPQAVRTVCAARAPHCIVVVARVFRIDRRKREVGEILPAGERVARNFLSVRLGFAHGFGRMPFFDGLAHEDLGHLDLRIAGVSEHGEELSRGGLARHLGKAGDARDGRLPVFARGTSLARVREHDGPAHARIVRLEPERLAAAPQNARHTLVPALEHTLDLPLRTAARSHDQTRDDEIAVHRTRHPILVDVEIVVEADTRHEAEPSRVHGENPLA